MYLEKKIKAVASMIIRASDVVLFTGAGISTESGIPDFRSPGGLWTRFDPEDFTITRFLSSAETRKKQWDILLDGGLFPNAEPNRAHLALLRLEKMGKLRCIITQNVDNLHQKAGNSPNKIYELHGNMNGVICIDCHDMYPTEYMVEKYKRSGSIPVCENCKGILKPDVVFFGEPLPEAVLGIANLHATRCELLIVIGSSLVVYPAAYIPVRAKKSGAKIVIVNWTPTPFDDIADVVINHSAGDVMERILDEVERGIVHK